MAILARTLHVRNFRNYDDYTLELDPGVTVLVGRNAQGKTNLVEALQLATSGASFRKPSPAELVAEGEESCSIALRLEGDGRVVDLGCTVRDGKRSFSRNGKKCRAAGVRGVVPSVLFCPDDLDMIKRSASVRRAALDTFGIQLNETYAQLTAQYERIVGQRNSLLKEGWCTREMLAAWNGALSLTGATLLMHRMALLARIRLRLREVYAGIAGGEEADVVYEPSFGALPPEVLDIIGAPLEREVFISAAREVFDRALGERADDEIRRGMTLVGPHRDEIRFRIAGRDARTFASQGQQRSLVLAWKVAEVEVTRDILGRPPLLLLDDVMSELDGARREAFLNFIQDEVQTVITTTNLGYFTDKVLDRAKVVEIAHGTGS